MAVALQIPYVAALFDQGNDVSTFLGSCILQDANYDREAIKFFIKKIKKLTRSWSLDEKDALDKE